MNLLCCISVLVHTAFYGQNQKDIKHETGRGTQLEWDKKDRDTDKEPGLSVVLLLAPPLSATRRISPLIRSTRLQHLALCVSDSSVSECPVWGNSHRPGLCPTWMGAERLLEVALTQKACLAAAESGGFWCSTPSSVEENVWMLSWYKIISQHPQNKSVDLSSLSKKFGKEPCLLVQSR